jgi:hypothetical protein
MSVGIPMAFEQLEPYRAEILQLRTPGPGRLAFSQLAEHLRGKYRLSTTPGTLCRYVKHLSPDLATREPSAKEHEVIDTAVLFAELLAEVRGRGEEQRRVLEQQAGEIRVLSEAFGELQGALRRPVAVEPALIRRIWVRAFLFSLAVTVPIAILVAWIVSRLG